MKEIKIADRMIGSDYKPFIVAEMSGNHNQSLERALAIVEAAARAGTHALKLQTYTADTMTLNIDSSDFIVDEKQELWQGSSLYELYQKASTPLEWHEPIFQRCRELGLIAFSTPFDTSAVDFLESCKAPCYKIASFENIDLPLIRKAASTGKPLIISTGMASLAEMEEAVLTARQGGCRELILLKCTSSYPANPLDSNLKTIPHMRELFQCPVGLSDHTMGIGAALASVALGAVLVEKHFTLDRAEGGVDSQFSLEPEEMKALVTESERAWQALGRINYGATPKEKDSMNYRRSLYITQDLKAGALLNEKNIRILRPGYGLAPRYYELVMGKTVKRDVSRGTPLSWEILF